MSQSKLSKVYDLQWELSNPQYYPDDSAPPVPNMSLSSVEPNSMLFNSHQDHVSITDRTDIPEDITDLPRFSGVPNDLGYDYRTGSYRSTADHLFYSYLNVESKIPPYTLNGRFDYINTYFRDFVPATCGVYNIEIPPGGTHLGYFCKPGLYKDLGTFAFSDKDELMFDTHRDEGPIINMSKSQPKRVDAIDFVFHLLDSSSNVGFEEPEVGLIASGPDFDLKFRLYARDARRGHNLELTVWLIDKSSDSPVEVVILDNFTIESLDHSNSKVIYFMFRVNLTEGKVEAWAENGRGDEFQGSSTFTPLQGFPRFSVQEFRRFGYIFTDYSVQLIGYTRESMKPLKEQYTDSIQFKKYYYPFFYNFNIYRGDADESDLNFTFPAYQGNAWSYLNQVATMFPYRRLV